MAPVYSGTAPIEPSPNAARYAGRSPMFACTVTFTPLALSASAYRLASSSLSGKPAEPMVTEPGRVGRGAVRPATGRTVGVVELEELPLTPQAARTAAVSAQRAAVQVRFIVTPGEGCWG